MIPITPLLILYITLLFAGLGLELVLTRINVNHLKQHGGTVPDPFKGYIDPAQLSRITDYTIENQNFGIITSCIDTALFVIIILSGLLPWLAGVIQGMGLGILVSGMIFFGIMGIAKGLISIPSAYYRTFVIEQRYGFNTSTIRIWIADIFKSAVLASLIGGVLLLSTLSIIEYGGRFWWLWAWFLFVVFQVVLVMLYPTVIAPLFNKFLPLKDETLEQKVKEMMRKSGLSVTGIFTMDAGKRSRHTNAYFAGLGNAKRIVLFDTLLTAHSHDEIIGILAHEIGHWKHKHVLKNLLLTGLFSLFLLYMVSILLQWEVMYQSFGFDYTVSYVGLFLAGVLWDVIAGFFMPIASAISRRFERQADFYAAGRLQETGHLISALKRLARDNLANLYPHPFYAWFYYSHPPLSERINYLNLKFRTP